MIGIKMACNECGHRVEAWPLGGLVRAHLLRTEAKRRGWLVGVRGPRDNERHQSGPRDYCAKCAKEANSGLSDRPGLRGGARENGAAGRA